MQLAHLVNIPRAVHFLACPVLNVLMLNHTKLAFLYMKSGWILAVTYGPTYTLYVNKKITYEKKKSCPVELPSIRFCKN